MKKFIFTTLFVLGMLHWRCSNETFIEMLGDKGDAQLGLTFPTSRGFGDSDINEELLYQVRMIIFKSNSVGIETGLPIINKIYMPLATDPIDEITITEIVPAGYLNIYLIGNEQASMNLDAVTNSAMLNARIVDYTSSASTPGGAFVSPPFVMYSAYKTVHISATGIISHPQVITLSGKTTFPIERTASKLTVHLNCDFVNIGNKAIAIDSALIISMPMIPRLVPQEYTGTSYFSTKLLDVSGYLVNKMTGVNVTGFETVTDGFTFYMPEHLINRTDRSHFTYLRLIGHLVLIPSTKLIYRVPLGNGLATNTAAHLLKNFTTVPAADLTVTRNVHYKLSLDIRGLGELSDVEVWAEVAPWKTKWIAGPIDAPYLNVSTVSAKVDNLRSQRIYFWSNRTDSIYVETIGKINNSSGSNFVVNNTFLTVAGHTPWPTNFTYNPATGIGYFDLILNTGSTITPERYLIYLKSGQLRREIEVFVDYKAPLDAANIRMTAYINAMYDFQKQKLEAYTTDGSVPTGYQWQVSTIRNGVYQDITGATSATYEIPVNYINTDWTSVDKSRELFFKCKMANDAGWTEMTDANALGMLFIRTNSPNYHQEVIPGAPVMPYLTMKRGGSLDGGKINVALLNLGQSGLGAWIVDQSITPPVVKHIADKAGTLNDAADLGDFYQWGRVADGHQHVVWSKDPTTRANQIIPTTGYPNGTSGVVNRDDGVYVFKHYGQIDNSVTTHYGIFIANSNGWRNLTGVADLWGNGDTQRNTAPVSFNGASPTWTVNARVNNPCPDGWRVPTNYEFWDMFRGDGSNLPPATSATPILNPFVYNPLTDNNQWELRPAQPASNSCGAVIITNTSGESLIWPATGLRSSGSLMVSPNGGYLWTSICFSATNGSANMISFIAPNQLVMTYQQGTGAAGGMPVRCVKNEPMVCTAVTGVTISSSGSTLVQVNTNAATLSVATTTPSSATTPFSYQWQRSIDNGTTWMDVIGANTNSLVSTALIEGVTKYRVLVSNACTATPVQSNVIDITGYGPEPFDNALKTYVGAFWKWNQRGERLIRIAGAPAYYGAWTATVIVGNSWIVLDDVMTSDPNVGWRAGAIEASVHNGNDATFDTQHPVNSTATTVSGVMDASNSVIYFRIGLTSNAPSSTTPRYGVVLLTFKNHHLSQRIFIRQGESADFAPGQNSGTRWSPYNVGDINDLSTPRKYPNKVVAYPSQAGFFYQWVYDTSGPQYGFHPIYPDIPISPATVIPNWISPNGGNATAASNSAALCPTGSPNFKLPTGGSSTTNDFYLLMQNSKSVWGYYADGYFDRRALIANPFGSGGNNVQGRAVSVNTSNAADPKNEYVAYAGSLIYNATDNKSLFFPSAGSRIGNNGGNLSNQGHWATYWSSTIDNAVAKTVYYWRVYGAGVAQSQGSTIENYGQNVRCVQ